MFQNDGTGIRGVFLIYAVFGISLTRFWALLSKQGAKVQARRFKLCGPLHGHRDRRRTGDVGAGRCLKCRP